MAGMIGNFQLDQQRNKVVPKSQVCCVFLRYLAYIPNICPSHIKPLSIRRENIVKLSSQVLVSKPFVSLCDECLMMLGWTIKVGIYSGRVCCCWILYNAGFEEQTVIKRSVHWGSAVRSYKRASEEK